MQYLVAINQSKALAWGLNAQQAMLFAFLHQVPTWADARQIDGQTFYNVAKTKIVAELPLLTDKADTAYRLMKQLAGFGVIEITSCDNRTYIRLTAKGKTWNRGTGSEKYPTPDRAGDSQGSEKNPTSEKSPSGVGKISDLGSEKSPTNQDTNDHNPNTHTAGPDALFDRASQFADDGQPLTGGARQFPMTLDWRPDANELAMACQRAGLPLGTEPTDAQLAKFTAHHADNPNRRHGSMAWTAKLVDWIRNDQRNANTQPTGGAANANGRQRTPSRRLSAAEARERDRQQREQPAGGQCFEGEWRPGH